MTPELCLVIEFKRNRVVARNIACLSVSVYGGDVKEYSLYENSGFGSMPILIVTRIHHEFLKPQNYKN